MDTRSTWPSAPTVIASGQETFVVWNKGYSPVIQRIDRTGSLIGVPLSLGWQWEIGRAFCYGTAAAVGATSTAFVASSACLSNSTTASKDSSSALVLTSFNLSASQPVWIKKANFPEDFTLNPNVILVANGTPRAVVSATSFLRFVNFTPTGDVSSTWDGERLFEQAFGSELQIQKGADVAHDSATGGLLVALINGGRTGFDPHVALFSSDTNGAWTRVGGRIQVPALGAMTAFSGHTFLAWRDTESGSSMPSTIGNVSNGVFSQSASTPTAYPYEIVVLNSERMLLIGPHASQKISLVVHSLDDLHVIRSGEISYAQPTVSDRIRYAVDSSGHVTIAWGTYASISRSKCDPCGSVFAVAVDKDANIVWGPVIIDSNVPLDFPGPAPDDPQTNSFLLMAAGAATVVAVVLVLVGRRKRRIEAQNRVVPTLT